MGMLEVTVLLAPSLLPPVPGTSSLPARLMLAGVALIEAGVRVLLLLLGVMPVRNGPNYVSPETYFWFYNWGAGRGTEVGGKKGSWGYSLAVQWLELCAPTAEGTGSIPGRGTNIPQATRCGQINT